MDYDASYITPWAARFRRSSAPTHRVVRELERRAWASRVAERDAREYAAEVQARLAHKEAEVVEVRAAMDREVALLRGARGPATVILNRIGRAINRLLGRG